MDFKEYLDKYVFKASHPLTERAKQREETLKAILIEEEIEKGKTAADPTNEKTAQIMLSTAQKQPDKHPQ